MAFDYKKEFPDLYRPKGTPSLVTVPPMRYVAIRGEGDPNEEGGAYKSAMTVLYAVSFTLRMSAKAGHAIDGYFEYVVPPLEGFWRQAGGGAIDYTNKEGFCWISCIRLPDFVTDADFAWAVEEGGRKKGLDLSAAELLTVEEGLCVQCMHTGSYDDEPATLARMNAFAAAEGCVPDLTETRLHHELYLSDPRKCAPDKLKTVIRQPVRRL